MFLGTISADNTGSAIQGFSPRVITTAIGVFDLTGYCAFRVSSTVDYTFGVNDTATLYAGSITVCQEINSITFASSVVIELM